MAIITNIQALRAAMSDANIDAYLIPSADFHQSEYVGAYFKARAFFTGFSGSAGTALITADKAYLWTDGRYFIQAEQELEGTEIELCRMGNPGVPTISQFLQDVLPDGSTLGFDGRVVSLSEGQEYEEIMTGKKGAVRYDVDFISDIWSDRPELSKEPSFHLAEQYTGASTASKLSAIREAMKEANAEAHIITALDDLCWTFNFRGNDVKFSPVVLGYAMIYPDSVSLFIDEKKLDAETKADLALNNVTYYPYNDIYDDIKNNTMATLMLDPTKLNYALYKNIPETCTRIETENPSILMKSIKNDVELDNIRAAHIKDGIAVTKYMRWVKMNAGTLPMSELSASDKLEEFRGEQEGFLWPSFAPICAYKEHAALCHYSSTPETNYELKAEGLFLNDTGGNYYEGSTDITRTFALGTLTEDEILHFTLVAKGMLALADATFLEGIGGHNLDILARQPFWERGLDFNHGTGHGVGYLLSIHEGPAGIRWQVRNGQCAPLKPGMILTDEPGLYIAGSHGIRTENELIIRKGTKNEYGQFLYFEPITFVPIDLDAIDPSIMSEIDKKRLNNYHEQVWEKISPYLDAEEQEWLKKYTRDI